VIQLTKRDDSVYPGTDHPFRKRIVTDVPREKSYHLKPRLLGKIAVVKCKYEVISTKIKKSLLKVEIITWASLEHDKQPVVLPDPNFLKEVSMRPAYPSSKKVKDYDKLEAEKDDKLEGDAALNKFFREIYLNSDEDMRSARTNHLLQCFGILIDFFAVLHNQQVESIGTMLSIDWKDVGAKKIKKTLHDDLALKTWKI
ncbi:hypothetical protein HID58_023645, partial [Brassica napus]